MICEVALKSAEEKMSVIFFTFTTEPTCSRTEVFHRGRWLDRYDTGHILSDRGPQVRTSRSAHNLKWKLRKSLIIYLTVFMLDVDGGLGPLKRWTVGDFAAIVAHWSSKCKISRAVATSGDICTIRQPIGGRTSPIDSQALTDKEENWASWEHPGSGRVSPLKATGT